MTSAPASSAPPALPDSVAPQNTTNHTSPRDNSASDASAQPSSFAKVFHQAKDDARDDADSADKSQHEHDGVKQSAVVAYAPVSVPLDKPKLVPIGEFLTLGGKSTDATEKEPATTSSDEKKSDSTASKSPANFLMQAIAGFGIPQFTQVKEAAKPQERAGALTNAAPVAPAATEDPNESLSVSLETGIAVKDGKSQNLLETMPPQDGEGQAAVSSGQLALAARLNSINTGSQQSPAPEAHLPQAQASHTQAAESNVESSPAIETASMQPVSVANQTVQTAPEHAAEQNQKLEGQALPTASASSEPATPARTDAAHALDQPTDVRSADVDVPTAGANASAVRDVRLQVAGSDNQRVDVRVMDRGGELRVSVRADDPALVRSLQDNVADLSTRLDQAHFKSEVWTPRTQAIAQSDSANTNGRTFSNGDGTFGRDGRGQQQSGRQQQQPSWVDDFEENPARPNSGGTPQWQR